MLQDPPVSQNTEEIFEFDPSQGWTFDLDTGLDRDEVSDLNDILAQQDSLESEAREFLRYCEVPEINRTPNIRSLESEVGDDEEIASNNTMYIAMNKVFQNRFGMKTSKEDTCINPRYGNFAEELVIKPDHHYQTYNSVRNTNRWDDLAWIDIPKIRLALNVQPMRLVHSSTKDGKYNMVGSRQTWISRSHRTKGVYELFGLFQDVNLGVTREPKPAYLPTALGGYGKAIPFGNVQNYERFLKAYKTGRYKELVRELVQRTNLYLGNWLKGNKPLPDPILSYVSRTESFFNDWVKNHSVYAKAIRTDLPPFVEVARIVERGHDPVTDDVVGRLIAEGLLITETQVGAIVEHNELCTALSGAVSIDVFKKIRDDARHEWSDASAFSNTMRDMFFEQIRFDRSLQENGSTEIYRDFVAVLKSARGSLKSILRCEQVFDREVIDEIYQRGPMMVRAKDWLLPQLGDSKYAVAPQYDVAEPAEVAGLQRLLEWVKGPRDQAPPLDLINDDNALIREAQASRKPVIYVVTDDKKLCKSMYFKVRKPILRIHCEWWTRILAYSDTGGSEEVDWFFRGICPYKMSNGELLIDTGSLDTAMSRSGSTGTAGLNTGVPFNFEKRLEEKDQVDDADMHREAQNGPFNNEPDPYRYLYGSFRGGNLPRRGRQGIPR